MRRILSTLLAVSTLALAFPVNAQEMCSGPHCTNGQYWPNDGYNNGYNGNYNGNYNGYQQPYYGNNSSNNNGGSAVLGAAAGAIGTILVIKGLQAMSDKRSEQPTRFDPDSNEDSVLVGRVGQERKYQKNKGCRLADDKFQTHKKYLVGSCGNTAFFFSPKDGSRIGPIPYAN
ncbi:MAG: hypothetical protein EON60_07595 [Alphaproteobacteria bacterium]|nr:MAG: hypothetical protein EON60_07595 [Alphaproteobacteria bacterium]